MKPEPLLDLHGFVTSDVVDAVDRFLVKCMRAGHKRVRIMTGKGTGQVKKTVVAYLKLGGYPHEAERRPGALPNDGVLVVFLDD